MKKLFITAGALAYGAVLAASCADHAPAPAPLAAVDRTGITNDNVSYDNYIGRLINTRCKTCHNPASELSTRPALDAWVNERTYLNAADHSLKIVTSIEQNTMPVARPMPQAEKELLRAWLDRGAPKE